MSLLANQTLIDSNHNKSFGDYMGGSVHFDKQAKRYFISIYWEGERYRVFNHPATQEPFYARKSAEKILDRIRSEIDYGEFVPKSYFPDSPLSLENYALEWLDCISVSFNTLKDYRYSFKNFVIPFFGSKDIRKIRHNDLLKFYKSIQRSDKGKYNVLSCLKTMLRYAWRNEDIKSVPPFPKLTYQLPTIEYLTFEQQEKAISAIPERDRPIFYFMQEYGVRPGEARALQKDCISSGEIFIKRAFADHRLRETTKSGKVRSFPVTDFMQTVLDQIPYKFSVFIFVRIDGKPYASRDLNRIWHKACSEVGIKIKMYNAFRHSLGCQLLDQGEDIDLVREQLGHSKAEMTRRYAKRSPVMLQNALNKRRGNVVKFTDYLLTATDNDK